MASTYAFDFLFRDIWLEAEHDEMDDGHTDCSDRTQIILSIGGT